MTNNKLSLKVLDQGHIQNQLDFPNYDNRHLKEYCESLREKYELNNKILFIQPPQFLFESFNLKVARNKGYYAYPPTGLQYLAKAISNRNLEINLLDLNYLTLKKVNFDFSFDYRNWLDILDIYLNDYNPSIIGITSLTAYGEVLRPTHPLTDLLNHLRMKDKHIIIIGGPTPTNEYENYLKSELCHFVVAKEGELKINFLLDILYNGFSANPPVNEIYFRFNGNVEQTKGIKRRASLNGNLIDTYKMVNIEDYKNVGSLNPYSRMISQDKAFSVFQLNRGCRANCKFCDVTNFMGRGVRNYVVDDIINEILYLVKERGVRHFDVLDDDFLGDKKTASDLLIKLIPLKEKYDITWSANNGLLAISLTEDILNLIRDSGCIGFRIGIESGNKDMLIKIRKPATLTLLREKGQLLQKYPEMFIGANYILGLFGEETFEQMLDTFRFAYDMNLDWSSISVFQFTSKERATEENLKSKGGVATDFIPAKDYSSGEIKIANDVVAGPDVFNINKQDIPTPEQVKQIWFTFNLVLNYINNKNLKFGGMPEKFVSWVEAVQMTYPNNPYMYLFTSIAHVMLGNIALSEQKLKATKLILKNSKYWEYRFQQFNLMDLVYNFPKSSEEVHNALDSLRNKYSKWTG